MPPILRERADRARIGQFLTALGREARVPARVYLTGGATAVLEGWRASTIDIVVRLDPDRDELLRAIADIKDRVDVNVELASPADFIPELPGWRDRSPFVRRVGQIDVFHYDPYSQALAKVERGFAQDVQDVAAMVKRGLVDPARALELFAAIEPRLFRFPSIDPRAFRRRVEAAFAAPEPD